MADEVLWLERTAKAAWHRAARVFICAFHSQRVDCGYARLGIGLPIRATKHN
jgi:hypothetical protein